MFKQDKKYTTLPWLVSLRQELEQLLQTGRCPHALLFHGCEGSGRRQLAIWFAEAMLGVDLFRPAASGSADEAGGHPDLLTVEPDEGKAVIRIEQIRELVEFFQLTSHGGRGRLALIWPADSMNRNAANSLLKTLEEPPPGSVIVLISESPARLPATIVSRCQRVRVPVPGRDAAVQWLEGMTGAKDLDAVIDFAAGAPLMALDLYGADFAATARGFANDFEDLYQRRANPVEVATRWNRQPELALDWLAWRLAGQIRAALCGPEAGVATPGVLDTFRQLQQIRELRRFFKSGISTELSLAGLLIRWYGGHEHPGR